MNHQSDIQKPRFGVEVRGLSKRFVSADANVTAVEAISFEVGVGKFYTLLGPSGCGKTTTLRMLAGLERPDDGEIRLGARLVYSRAEGTFVPPNRRAIGMVFQSYAIWPHMTVFDNVAYPLTVKKLPRSEVKGRVETALAMVGLEELARRPAPRLSGGQQQRVALARALVAEPDVLLLDEPLSNLDAKLRRQMRDELKRLQSEVGITTVYVTHDQEEALSMSDELLVMNRGQMVQKGTSMDVYHRPLNHFAATFVGSANFLAASALDGRIQAGRNRLDTPIGVLTAEASPLSVGAEKADVCLRPEAINLLADNRRHPVGENVFDGLVQRTTFLGDRIDYEIRIGQTLLRARAPSTANLEPGGPVRVYIPPDYCTILSSEDGREAAERIW